MRLLAPILSFTCEEVWRHARPDTVASESVHIEYFPQTDELTGGITSKQRKRAAEWDRLIPIRDQVLKALDIAREDKVIGSSLEAAVSLKSGGDAYSLLQNLAAELPAWFIVSEVELEHDASAVATIRVERASGDKCERCWKYTRDVGSDEEFPTVCAACASVVREFWS